MSWRSDSAGADRRSECVDSSVAARARIRLHGTYHRTEHAIWSRLAHYLFENSLSGGRVYPCSIAARSRSIDSMSVMATSGNGDNSGDVDGLEIGLTRAADLDAAVLALFVGCGGDERLAVLAAVDAAVLVQLPARRAKRTAKHAMAVGDLRERRPRSADRAVAVIPRPHGVREHVAGGILTGRQQRDAAARGRTGWRRVRPAARRGRAPGRGARRPFESPV